jgi:lipoprotein-anchoring transpeptidase ErfK/SrfK
MKMGAEINLARQALQKAINALHRHDQVSARQWAQQATVLAPHMEGAWLILAVVSETQAAREYLERANKINPSSQLVRDGWVWLEKREAVDAQKQSRGVEDSQITQWVPDPSILTISDGGKVTQAKNPHDFSGKLKLGGVVALLGGLSVLLFLILVLLAGLVLTYKVSGVKAAVIEGAKNQPQWVSSIPDVINITPTSIMLHQYVFVATPTPSLTATVTVTRTPNPSPTHIPTLLPFVTATSTGPKRIVVVISEQRVHAYQGNQEIYQFVASTGMNDNTPTGHFTVLEKIPNPYSYAYGFWMPLWMGFYWAGDLEDGFHSLPVLPDGGQIWGDTLGTPASYGCVVLGPNDAQLLYDWADVGTQVEIRE